ncbi:MAG: sugar ABC transporter permease [Armatimonadetes bacterium]|nr:sugar ABC transporter permease [Armatimonadota bacterium]
MKTTSLSRREALAGWLFVSPWVLGFVIFAAGPILFSLGLSFAHWDAITRPEFAGLDNYRRLARDPLLIKSLINTAYYAVVSVPMGLCLALGLALLLNQKLRAMGLFRTLFYLPSVTSGVATMMLWMWLFNPELGLINRFLRLFTKHPPLWLSDVHWAMPALILMSLWGAGGAMLIFLAGLQNIPEELYEASTLDGAGSLQQFRHVTIPLLSPVIFFNFVMAVIASFQVFTAAFIMTNGGPSHATLLYVLYLFQNAFVYFRLGYASAMAWLLFVIILFLTLLNFRLSKRWVHYG